MSLDNTVVGRLLDRLESIADTMVDTYRQNIADYHRLASPEFDRDVRAMSVKNLTSLLAHLEHGRLVDDDELADIRASAARRVHQGVPLDALLHAYRLWGEVAWEEILAESATAGPETRDAAMRMAGRLIQQLNLVSTELTRGYLSELEGVRSDHDALERELVESLVTVQDRPERAERLAEALSRTLAPVYVAVVAGLAAMGPRTARLERAAQNRRALAIARRVTAARSSGVLVTLRHEHLVLLVPGESPRGGDAAAIGRTLATELAPLGYAVGVGAAHRDSDGTRASYREAGEALEVAAVDGSTGEPVEFDRVIVDSILRNSPLTDRLIDSVLGPLRRHDADRASELEDTLAAYIDTGFSVARAARRVNAHANTVVYRLQKIHEISGRDPRRPADLAELLLAVRASRTRRSAP